MRVGAGHRLKTTVKAMSPVVENNDTVFAGQRQLTPAHGALAP
jgi:hypothetical protein